MKKKKQRGSLERVTGTIFILVLFVFLLINIIVPDKEKSVQENRMLASAPKWNWGICQISLSAEISGERSRSVWTDWQVSARNMEYI